MLRSAVLLAKVPQSQRCAVAERAHCSRFCIYGEAEDVKTLIHWPFENVGVGAAIDDEREHIISMSVDHESAP